MNSKLAVLTVILLSGVLLSSCSSQSSPQDTSTIPNQNNPAPTGQPGGSNGPRIDFAAAAKKLGVTEDALKEALGNVGNPGNPPQN